MLFPSRVDSLPRKTGLALGSVSTFEITREFHAEGILLRVEFTPTAVMASDNADSIQNIVKLVTLAVSDGARTRNIVNMTGPGLLEYARQLFGALDPATRAAINVDSITAKVLFYYIPFAHPQIDDPNGSTLLLPLPRFNQNPVLTVTLASQADMDTAGATFAVAAGVSLTVTVLRRQVGVKNWPTYDTELKETTTPTFAIGANKTIDLDVPGSYTGILLRGFTSATSRVNPLTANGFISVSALGTSVRRWIKDDLEALNAFSMTEGTANPFTTSLYLDFLSDRTGLSVGDLGSVLDTNVLAGTGAKAQLVVDIGVASSFFNVITHRIFGDLSPLKLSLRKKA